MSTVVRIEDTTVKAESNGEVIAAGQAGIDDARVLNTALGIGGMVSLEGNFILKAPLAFSADVYVQAVGSTLMLDAKIPWTVNDDAGRITLENLVFNGNRDGIGPLTDVLEKSDGWFRNVESLRVIGCEFSHFSGTPIAVKGADMVTVEVSRFHDILGSNTYGGTSTGCSAGVYLRNVDAGFVRGCQFDTIDDNAVGISGSQVQVIGNTMRECRFLAYVADSPERQMGGAMLIGNDARGLYRGVVLGFGQGNKAARNVTIQANHIETDATVSRWAGVHDTIHFDAIVTEAEVKGLLIRGNVIKASARGLYQGVAREMQNIIIGGNHIEHRLSNNLNLGVADCVIVDNTIITNGVNASQRPLQTVGCDVHGNKWIINQGTLPSLEGGNVFDNFEQQIAPMMQESKPTDFFTVAPIGVGEVN